jgi:hypothetical protein
LPASLGPVLLSAKAVSSWPNVPIARRILRPTCLDFGELSLAVLASRMATVAKDDVNPAKNRKLRPVIAADILRRAPWRSDDPLQGVDGIKSPSTAPVVCAALGRLYPQQQSPNLYCGSPECGATGAAGGDPVRSPGSFQRSCWVDPGHVEGGVKRGSIRLQDSAEASSAIALFCSWIEFSIFYSS